jgi:Spy/CpxP family protein refolding chaperone
MNDDPEEARKKYWDEMRAKMEKQEKAFAALTPEKRARLLDNSCKRLGIKPSDVVGQMIRQNTPKKDKP